MKTFRMWLVVVLVCSCVVSTCGDDDDDIDDADTDDDTDDDADDDIDDDVDDDTAPPDDDEFEEYLAACAEPDSPDNPFATPFVYCPIDVHAQKDLVEEPLGGGVADDGTILAAWVRYEFFVTDKFSVTDKAASRAPDPTEGVYARRFTAGGEPLEDEKQLVDENGDAIRWGAASFHAFVDGTFTLAYRRDGAAVLQRFSADGEPQAPVVDLTAEEPMDVYFTRLVDHPDGTYSA